MSKYGSTMKINVNTELYGSSLAFSSGFSDFALEIAAIRERSVFRHELYR